MNNATVPYTQRQRVALAESPPQSRQRLATMFRQQNGTALVRYNPFQAQSQIANNGLSRNTLLRQRIPTISSGSPQARNNNRRNRNNNIMSLSRPARFLSAPVMSAPFASSETSSIITITRRHFFASNFFDNQKKTPFQVTANDLVPASMPWFNGICELYDEYRYRRLAVRYMGAVSTATSGRAFMYFEYNRSRVLPESLQQAQAGDRFTFFPHWSNPSPTISPSRLDPNKWYKTDPYAVTDLGGQTTYSETTPATLMTGFDATQPPPGLGQLGDYEIDVTIQFRGPRPIAARFTPGEVKKEEPANNDQEFGNIPELEETT